MSDNYLIHYGVLGMKWGIRKGNYSTTFVKASKKADKLKNKADSKTTEYNNYVAKNSVKLAKSKAKMNKQQSKSNKLGFKYSNMNTQAVTKKWYNDNGNPYLTEQANNNQKNRYEKLAVKTNNALSKNNKKLEKTSKKVAKLETGLAKKQAASIKANKRSEKWLNSMSKAFSQVSINDISSEARDYGKKYIDMLMQN